MLDSLKAIYRRLRPHLARGVFLAGILGLWVLDIAANVGGSGVTNGFWELSQTQAFHLGLWISLAALVYGVLRG